MTVPAAAKAQGEEGQHVEAEECQEIQDTLNEQPDSPGSPDSSGDDSELEGMAVEVFVGGLPPDVREEEVQQAFAAVGQVTGLRLNRRKRTGECKGFGFVRYADQGTAEKACSEVREVCGKAVGVHISRGRSVDQLVEDQIADVQDDADPDASVNKLLRLLRSHTDRKAAISAALKAVMTLPSRKVVPAEDPAAIEASPPVSEPPMEPIPDPESFLDSFLRCKHLVETFRANPSTHNKTPLAILHEYATRLGLELAYNETSEGTLGPFNVEAKLTSVGGSVLYATGSGRGRGKKDAKQVSAAAVLEMLLVNVPESDFLMPGKAKQTKTVQPSLRVGRQADFGRGRGRVRSTGGRYMSQRSTADYVDTQLAPSYNESVYYGMDRGAGYVNNSAGFGGVSAPPQTYNLDQQPQGFGMNVNGHTSGPLGHVGDSRGVPAPFQQGPNLGEHHFSGTPGPVFNPGTGFNSRPNNGFASTPQNFANTPGFASSGSLISGPSAGGLGGNVSSISPVNLGSGAHNGANPYHTVYNISPNSIPLGAGRPLLNGMGY
ncbi:hypothetical protein ABBQ38_009496 [Trebouxia sp. C0009 RCD-2024]